MASPGDAPDLVDDDPSSWVPLEPKAGIGAAGGAQSTDIGREGDADQVPWDQSVRSVLGMDTNMAVVVDPHASSYGSGNAAPSSNAVTRRRDDLQSIRRRLETKQTLKENFVDHPLNQFAGKFVMYLLSELWSQDYYVRSGLVLLGVGSLMQLLAMLTLGNTILREYYRAIFILIVLALSYLYIFRPDETLVAIVRFISNSSAADAFLHLLENLDAIQLRRACLVLAMIPTLLEMKAVTFLAATIVEAGWITNIAVALASFAYLRHSKEKERISSRECSIRGLACLYVSALLVAITHVRDVRRINTLAAPFVLAAGAFLISNHPAFSGDEFDWLSRAVRYALRLSLRDVLATVGQNVEENEMLQLAMLRWVVDYWSHAPDADANAAQGRDGGSTTTTGEPSNQRERARETEVPVTLTPVTLASGGTGDQASNDHQRERPSVVTEQRIVSESNRSSRSTDLVRANDSDISWNHLFAMLNMTTDQMLGEVNQQEHSGPSHSQPADSHFADENESVTNLQSMLGSFDVDGRAKPAVLAYKSTVLNVPPSRNIAIALAIVRRCPATLALLSWYSFGSYDSVCATITLLPLIWIEVMRLREWSQSCQDAARTENRPNETNSLEALVPADMEPMIILFSPDSYSPYRPTSSMQVWANVKASVSALETGLTAVRCVQTTYVAKELTFDVVSLAQFGVEVYSKGWLHGGALVVRDVCHFMNHQSSGRQVTRDSRAHGRYTAAAVNAARSSEVVARNVGIIMDEGGNQVIGPVVDALTFVVGRGWLWGKEDEGREDSNAPQSDGEDAKNTAPQAHSSGINNDEPDRADEVTCELEEIEHESPKDCKAMDSGDREEKPESKVLGHDDQADTCREEPKLKAEEADVDRDHVSTEMKNVAKEDERAETLQLMAEALEKGLITEKEKDNLVEMLLAEKKTETGVDAERSHSNAAAAVRKSLEGLFLDAPPHDTHALATACDAADGGNDSVGTKEESGKDDRKSESTTLEDTDSKGNASEESAYSSDEVASIPLSASATTAESWENTGGVTNDLVFDENNDDAAEDGDGDGKQGTPARSNVKSVVSDTNIEGESPTRNADHVFQDDDDDEDEGSWTEIDHDGLPVSSGDEQAAAHQPFGGQSIRSMTGGSKGRSLPADYQTEKKEEDWMKWVGGSLAVAGGLAVAVGGMAMASANQGSDNRSTSSRRSEMKNASTVTIELLDSDDES